MNEENVKILEFSEEEQENVPEAVEPDVVVSTSWGFPISISIDDVTFLGTNDFALVLESDLKSKKGPLKAPECIPGKIITDVYNKECRDQIDNMYKYQSPKGTRVFEKHF